MCNAQTQTLIDQVVDEYVGSDKLFTAFDVSLEVQKRAQGQGVPVERHRHMKNSIHSTLNPFVDDSFYSKSLQSVGASNPAFVYYPTSKDPSEYIPLVRKDNSSATAQSQVATAPSTNGTAVVSSPTRGKGYPDGRGTVCIPQQFIDGINAIAGDRVYVEEYDDDGDIYLTVSKTEGVAALTSYTVDVNRNVRITAPVVKHISPSANSYDFEVNGDNILIKPHVDLN